MSKLSKRPAARIGRPPVDGVPRDVVIQIRFTEAEAAQIHKAAKAGKKEHISTWLRSVIMENLKTKPAPAKKVAR